MEGDSYPQMPKVKPGAAKYAGFTTHNKGLYTLASFKGLGSLSYAMKRALVNSANNNLAAQSWNHYKTVSNHLVAAQITTGVKMKFPMDTPMILAFIAYLTQMYLTSLVCL